MTFLLRQGVALAATAALAWPALAQPSTSDALTRLAQDYIAHTVQTNPIAATHLGVPGHDGELDRPSEGARAALVKRLQRFRTQLDAIVTAEGPQAPLVVRNDAKLLRARFDGDLNELRVRQSDRKNLAASGLRLVGAIYTQFLHLPIVGRDGATQADLDRAWADIVSRLAQGAAYIEAGQRLVTKPGRLFGVVGSAQLDAAPEFFNGPLTDAARAQLAASPQTLQRFVAARDAVLATLARTKAFIDAHAARWPENHVIGEAAYNQMLRDEQLVPFDAEDVERLGRVELANGWAEEVWLTALSTERRRPFGAASGGGMAPGGSALVGYYRERIAELRRFVEDHNVITVPAWLGAMEIVETPSFLQPVSPGASMNAPRLFSPSTTGYYFITPPASLDDAAARLDMNQDFDRDRIWSTAAHEAMPGHFLQLSIARRHPDYVRKISDSASFAEGWAFYGEAMFVRLGLYGDDLDAQLFTARWERVRGARAVVDAKLASGAWTVAQAVDFFTAQSGFTREAAQAAVQGIALGPGYVISYTVGRLQLQELLGEYMRRTGDTGSLRDFHDRLLSYGSVPFSIVAPELLADLDKPASVVRAAANY